MPRLTQQKQAREVYLATGKKAKGGTKKGEKRSEVHGTGLKGRAVKTAVARQSATAAEQKYEQIIAERAAGKQTHADSRCLIGQQQSTLDPLRPQAED